MSTFDLTVMSHLKENRALRNQYEELQKSLEFHIGKLESLEMENNKLKQEVSSLKKQFVTEAEDEIADLNDDLDGFKSDLGSAINQIDDLEQYTRKHNLKIHGIPESSEENLADRIIKLGKVLNVHIANVTATSTSVIEWLYEDLTAVQGQS